MQAEHEPEPLHDPLVSEELEHPKAPAMHGYVILKRRESKTVPQSHLARRLCLAERVLVEQWGVEAIEAQDHPDHDDGREDEPRGEHHPWGGERAKPISN